MAEVYSSLYKGLVHVTTPFKSTHKALDLGNYKTRNDIFSANKLGEGSISYIANSYKDSAGKLWNDSLVVYAKYDNGMTARHFHGQVNDLCVKIGQRIKPGDKIYKTGNTGNSRGDHLHYVLLNGNGVAVDPATWVINDKITDTPVTPPQPPQQSECEKEVERLNGIIKGCETTVKTLTDDNRSMSEENKELESEIKSLQSDYDRILQERDRFESDYMNSVKELNEYKDKNNMAVIIKSITDWVVERFDKIYAKIKK